MSNVRRDVIKKQRLTSFELSMIKEKVRQNVLGDNHPNETSVDVTSEEQPETPPQPLEAENPTEVAHERENHRKVVEMAESIKQRWERVKEMSIEERPTIPQMKMIVILRKPSNLLMRLLYILRARLQLL